MEESSTVAFFATVQNEGGRSIERKIAYYNLDVIISVGYRVKSLRGTQFRKWALKVLKEEKAKQYLSAVEKHHLEAISTLEGIEKKQV